MGSVILQRTQDSGWDWGWRLVVDGSDWQMSALWLETVLVGEVGELDDGAVWGGVLEIALHLFGLGVFVAGVLQGALLVGGDPVAGFEGGPVGSIEVHLGVLSDDGDGLVAAELGSGGGGQDGEENDLRQKGRLRHFHCAVKF